MLRFTGYLYLLVGLLGFAGVTALALDSPSPLLIALSISTLMSVLLVPAVLFGLSDIVRFTRETRDAVRDMGRTTDPDSIDELGAEPLSPGDWAAMVASLNEAREADERARKRDTTDRLER